MSEPYPRDLVGYGAHPPHPRWPGGARLALSFVLNYEEGGERSVLHGDPASEVYLHEVPGGTPRRGERDLSVESVYEYGARAGFWRILRLFTRARADAHRLRRRHGARAQSRRRPRDGRSRLRGRQPRLALDRLPRTCPRPRSART